MSELDADLFDPYRYALELDHKVLTEAILKQYDDKILFYSDLGANILSTCTIQMARAKSCREKVKMKGYYPPALRTTLKLSMEKPVYYCKAESSITPANHLSLSRKQKQIKRMVLKKFNESVNNNTTFHCLIQAPCGAGKTAIIVDIICKLNLKTIIIVNKKVLVAHWEKHFSNSIGSYEGCKKLMTLLDGEVLESDVNPDVLIAIDKHLANPSFCQLLHKKGYSLMVIDEIDLWNLNSHTSLSEFLMKMCLPVTIHTTATPRKDNKINYGEVFVGDHPDGFEMLKRYVIEYSSKEIDNILVTRNNDTKNDYILNPERNATIIKCALDYVDECKIIFTEKRDHMDILFNNLVENYHRQGFVRVEPDTPKYNRIEARFTKNDKVYILAKGDAELPGIQDYLSEANRYDIFTLVTTTFLCSSGINLPKVVSVLYTPLNSKESTVIQSAGRCERAPYSSERKFFVFRQGLATAPNIKKSILDIKTVLQANNWNVIVN